MRGFRGTGLVRQLALAAHALAAFGTVVLPTGVTGTSIAIATGLVLVTPWVAKAQKKEPSRPTG